jgi:hypothetical protein
METVTKLSITTGALVAAATACGGIGDPFVAAVADAVPECS